MAEKKTKKKTTKKKTQGTSKKKAPAKKKSTTKKKSRSTKKPTPIKKKESVHKENVAEKNEVVDLFDESPEVSTDFFAVDEASVEPVIEKPKRHARSENEADESPHAKCGRGCRPRPAFHIGRFFLGLTLIAGGFVFWLASTGWFTDLGLVLNVWQWWPILIVLIGLSVLPARGWVARTVSVMTIVLVVLWSVAVFFLGQVDSQAQDIEGVEIEITIGDTGETVQEEVVTEEISEIDDTADESELIEAPAPSPLLFTNTDQYALVSQNGTAVLVDSAGTETGFVVDNTLDDGTVIPSAVIVSDDETQVAYNYYSSVTGEMTIAVSSVDGSASQNVLTANPEEGNGGVVLSSIEWVESDTALQYQLFSSACTIYCQSEVDMEVSTATFQVDLATGEIAELLPESNTDEQ
jgi:hypothetical protein